MTSKRRICLFGLSADPPTGTAGHVGIARTLATTFETAFDEIRILPVYRHTFASKRLRLATFDDRLTMCRLAFAGLPRTIVTNDEYLSWCRQVKGITNDEERAKVSVGTAALLEYLQDSTQNDNVEFTFCLGADAFMDLTAGKWKESDRVLQLLQGRFLVLHRIQQQEQHQQQQTIADSSSSSSNTYNDSTTTNSNPLQQLQERVESVPSARLVSIPALGSVSSSQVRQAVATQDWGFLQDERIVPTKVLDYIRDKGLYSSSSSSS